MFQIEQVDVEGIRIFRISNNFVDYDTSALKKALDMWLAGTSPDAKPRIIIDLANVVKLDSCGLGALVAVYTTIMKRGGRIAFLVSKKEDCAVNHMLTVTRVDHLFEIFVQEEGAVRSFYAPSPDCFCLVDHCLSFGDKQNRGSGQRAHLIKFQLEACDGDEKGVVFVSYCHQSGYSLNKNFAILKREEAEQRHILCPDCVAAKNEANKTLR